MPFRRAVHHARETALTPFYQILELFYDFVAAPVEHRQRLAWQTRRPFMNTESKARTTSSINGRVIVLGAGHSIAIYERNGEGYVAEFRDGHASLEYAGSWFRFNAGALRCLRGRAALQSSKPLNPEMLQKIERLHAASDARQERMLAMLGNVATKVKRCLLSLVSWTRGGASRTSRTVG
jgi:hypothetical protein